MLLQQNTAFTDLGSEKIRNSRIRITNVILIYRPYASASWIIPPPKQDNMHHAHRKESSREKSLSPEKPSYFQNPLSTIS